MGTRAEGLQDDDYAHLLEFRTALRRFERWCTDGAAELGLTPTQHQLLLAVRGLRGERGPTVGDVAECLLIRHHSAVELVSRTAAAGLLVRGSDPDDGRLVRLALTVEGERKLELLSARNLTEVAQLAPLLEGLLPITGAAAPEG